MSQFTLTVTLGNDAMQTMADVADLLERAAESMRRDHESGEDFGSVYSLRDLNGNRVGGWDIAE
jgi:hypothetical protein